MKKKLLLIILFISHLFHAQSDCITAIPICGNSDISYTPTGPGAINEQVGPNSCLTREHYSVWYTFTIATPGTLAFTIDPNDDDDDYDFAVYGPTNGGCSSLQNNAVFVSPLRCNYWPGTTTGNTGLSLTIPPGSNNQNEWSPYMDVTAGETYYLIVDNFDESANGFLLNWTGTASLNSAFNDPALAPNPFITPGTLSTPPEPNEVTVCSGFSVPFDFTTFTQGIINGNSTNFTVTYHNNTNDAVTGGNPITTGLIDATTIYFYRIVYRDPANPANLNNGCFITGRFRFRDGNFTLTPTTLTSCSNNNSGTALYDLTTANIGAGPTHVLKYYPSLYDLNNGTNEITNPNAYSSAEGSVFVKATNPSGCIATVEITLKFHPAVTVTDAILRACYIEANPSTASFNLNNALVTTQANTTKRYFPSLTDAINETNEILNPANYIAPNGLIYVRVINSQGCYSIAKVTLTVLPPVQSDVLIDKIICMEDTTTLDAGPGFSGYEWSTGATTQTIKDVGVGTYWVKLKTGDCITLQTVKIYASEQPVVTSIDISNNAITINVTGGTPNYQYSMDNIIWQNSNVFTNISRGNHKVYVKDAYDCDPIEISVVVPNLVNVITPNGDGINDGIDYSTLADKQNLILNIFDRYGTKIHQADKSNGYKWDGTVSGKKIPTGTYWYSMTWNENDKKNTPIKFSGWIMVKNRD
ncbi:T9SS type B sorting domain-containing protein [Chryseobacterium sp. Bi04]|uniref:T9SS type B sorting domain-containing protein n=1 Tax=Chryseobacterium sp. Bi04 TaxID=2822345 RepID=UPI001D99BEC0|nr:T9SS type B sorting domain-containing protein [Chryseobacterium sp. Bi04]CAH0146068.1 hypothetical protein SRABI04_00661 [Chryseobacterium sp. Bi04]